MWEYVGAHDRCWRCGKRIDPLRCERHLLIPIKYGGRDDPSNYAKLDPNCHIMVHRKTGEFAGMGDKNPFVCPQCGKTGEVIGVRETRSEIYPELRCPQCGQSFVADIRRR